MPPDIPEDIWLHIIELRPFEDYPNARRFPRNLALTCRRLRLIATPFVYRTLRFVVEFGDDDDRPFEFAMTGIIRDLTRARSLLRSPYLLQHVQQLSLWNWDDHDSQKAISAYHFSSEGDMNNPVDTKDAGSLISVIYDLITRLILHMPGLRELTISQSPITPLLYTAICSLPCLTSFDVMMNYEEELHHRSSPVDPPPTLHIRELRYYNIWENGYLSNILAGSIMSLHTLSITSANLPLVPSYIRNRALPLKILQVQFLKESSADNNVHFALWDTLRAIPELRKLLIRGQVLDSSPPDDLCNRLCNLVQICASPRTIRKLAEGQELGAVEINKIVRISDLSISQMVPCSPTHLREIALNVGMPEAQQELDKFISSFRVFKSLEYLDIDHYFPDSPVTDAEFHESWKVIKDLWRELEHLHHFDLHGHKLFELPNEEPYGIEVACPLDINDELLPRGHPTLERISVSFLRRSFWEWDPEHGWVSEWSYDNWHCRSYMTWTEV